MIKVSVVNSVGEYKLQDIQDETLGRALAKGGMSGLEYASTRVSSFNKAGEDGIFISNMFYGERRISIPGVIYGKVTDATYEQARRDLITAFSIHKDSQGYLLPLTLKFTTNDGVDFQVTGQAVNITVKRSAFYLAEYMIDFLSDSIYIQKQSLTSVAITPYVGGGFIVPFVLPVTFSAGSGGSVIVTNNGSTPNLPTIVLTGPLTTPRLLNATTGFSMALNMTLIAGDVVTIDMANRTIIQGTSTNRMSTKSSDSEFWWLDPGNNTIILTTGSSGDTGTATVQFRDSFYGV